MKIRNRNIITICLMIYDAVVIAFSYFFGLWLRFDFRYSDIPLGYIHEYAYFIPFCIIFSIVLFWFMGLYRSIWSFVGFHELMRYMAASFASSLVHCLLISLILGRMPVSYYIVGTIIQLFLVCSIRFTYRIYREILKRRNRASTESSGTKVMIIGGGLAGRIVIKELMQTDKLDCVPCCVIDDNPYKRGSFIEGVPVVGDRNTIIFNAEKYGIDEIYFCIPSASSKVKKEILTICNETGCEMKSLPGIYQIANDEITVSNMRSVALEDLLGRSQIKVNMDEIYEEIKGEIILITGAGGSIGSELARQVAAHDPFHLILFDIYENTTYAVELELREKYPNLKLTVLIGSVRDSRRVNQIFEKYHPDIVYHAAAHKHVPLMEYNPNEAIKNNVIGTYKTAYAALKYGARRFVLISTDKAVNPTNIMGASKRLCEMVIQSMDAVSRSGNMDILPSLYGHADKDATADPMDQGIEKENSGLKIESVKNKNRIGTQFVAVRFGNVLGSNGSVIPRFKEQIAAGGPVTVTDPNITRYFMTIPEAVSLILQAGTYAWGGEIFVLDMGEPVKIDDLARNMILLSGFKPDEDIKIVYTGLRPGEKLYEEKLMAEEGLMKTENDLIYIGKPVPFDVETFLKQLEELAEASYENSGHIVEMVEKIVTTFHPVGEHPEEANK